ncbi:MetS family NSS transporter small subunit [Leucobacter salsicius]|uniref:MetS family NSS transporter small subunit n=1 Tax=Leucobacter salsicius TaxID=664638 RepID=UPI00034589F7|nr:MetS family NSS transporter small subunit [Leucobacter salsicius]
MTPIAITFLVIALTVIWGGLIASAIFLSKQTEVAHYPEGGEDAPGEPAEA